MFALGARLMIRLRLRHHRALFFFNDTATTEIYTLSLHDALPISWKCLGRIPRDLAGRHCGLRDYRVWRHRPFPLGEAARSAGEGCRSRRILKAEHPSINAHPLDE